MKLSVAPRAALCELLSSATIELSLRSHDRDGVFHELIGKVPELAAKAEARQALWQSLWERERLCSTGFGGGLAVPHTRNAIAGLDEAVIVFGRHSCGIPYEAADAMPVRLLFLLLAPSIREHLQILARLSRLLRVARLREELLAARDSEQVLAVLREAEESL